MSWSTVPWPFVSTDMTAIQQAGEYLKRAPFGNESRLLAAWNAITWKTVAQDIGAPVQAAMDRTQVMNIYPALQRLSPKRQAAALIQEFGIGLFRHAPKRARQVWEEKLCLPLPDQIAAVQDRLQNPEYTTYEAIVSSFARCMDRYVALNLVNALIQPQRVPRVSALNLDLRTWGSTADYASGRRPHRIVPFVYAYGPRQIAECPGAALADLAVNDLGLISESSVREALRRVIVEAFTVCC